MPIDQIILLLTIAGSAAFTPGPNNALLAASGASHGMRATLPHIAGIMIGFPFMIFLVGFFLGEIFQRSTSLQLVVQSIGIIVLFWMAWRTARSGPGGKASSAKPFTFLQSMAFQWINPKGWTFAIGVTSQFVDPENPVVTAMFCAGAFVVMGFGSAFVWAWFGQSMTRILTTELRWRIFNITMGGLIAFSALMLFVGG